jgi:hypothetical protein
MEKLQEISRNENQVTYLFRFIQGETRGMDLHIGTTAGINSSALQVACPPPAIGTKISDFFFWQKMLMYS